METTNDTPEPEMEMETTGPADQSSGEDMSIRASNLDTGTEEAQLKARLAEIRKLKQEQKKASKGKGNGTAAKAEKVVKEKVARAPKDEQNGISRPGMGVTKEVWDTADMLSKRLGTFVDRQTLTEVLNGKIETGTIHTQYGRWRKYYGLSETKDQRAARLEQIRAKKLADLGLAPQQEEQVEVTK